MAEIMRPPWPTPFRSTLGAAVAAMRVYQGCRSRPSHESALALARDVAQALECRVGKAPPAREEDMDGRGPHLLALDGTLRPVGGPAGGARDSDRSAYRTASESTCDTRGDPAPARARPRPPPSVGRTSSPGTQDDVPDTMEVKRGDPPGLVHPATPEGTIQGGGPGAALSREAAGVAANAHATSADALPGELTAPDVVVEGLTVLSSIVSRPVPGAPHRLSWQGHLFGRPAISRLFTVKDRSAAAEIARFSSILQERLGGVASEPNASSRKSIVKQAVDVTSLEFMARLGDATERALALDVLDEPARPARKRGTVAAPPPADAPRKRQARGPPPAEPPAERKPPPGRVPRRARPRAEELFEVDRILEERWDKSGRGASYLVLWAGYPRSEASWEPHEGIKHTDAFREWVRGRGGGKGGGAGAPGKRTGRQG